MISIYTGTPGSGKSLHVAERIYWRDHQKRWTIGNFEIVKDKLKNKGKYYCYIPNEKLATPKLIIEFSNLYFSGQKKRREADLLLVLDECQLMFNARTWMEEARKEWISFFTQSRKYGFDIVLIAQFDMMIDRQIRSLVEYNFIHRKVSNFGIGGKVLSVASAGKTFVAVKMWYPLNDKVGQEFFTAKKKYYSIYDTFNTFSAPKKVDEEQKAIDLLSFDCSAPASDAGLDPADETAAEQAIWEEDLEVYEDHTEQEKQGV